MKASFLDSESLVLRRANERALWSTYAYQGLYTRMIMERRYLSRYRWDSMMAYYHTDLLNFPEKKEDIYAGLVQFTCKKTGLSTEEVHSLFSRLDQKVVTDKISNIAKLEVADTSDPQVKLVSCGDIAYEISRETWTAFGKDKNFLEVFLSYSFLNPDTGLFWSMAKEAYKISGSADYGIKVLECFASPFNYNLNSFCSVFAVDRLLTYPSGVTCYGDFFDYIKKLKTHTDPVRLVVNPPYTDRIIDKVGDELVSYMEAQPDGELIAMLPDWTPQAGIEKLKAIQGSVWHYFASKEFHLFDSVHQETIRPRGMKLLIIVNFGHDSKASQDMLSRLVDAIKTSAAPI